MRQERTQRERRFRLRWRENLAIGVGVGLAIGGGLGVLLGVIAFEPGSRGMWGSIVAGVLFGVVLGAFEAGMASLESPQPGREPAQAERPVRDVSELTETERDVPSRDVGTDPEAED
jgi:hypothetical protein